MSVATQAEKDLSGIKAYLASVWKQADHGFATVEEAIESAIKNGHALIAGEGAEKNDTAESSADKK